MAPRRFSEKMQWRKLFDMNPLYAILSDKLSVRDFIASRVGETYLVPLIWSGTVNDIPFDRLRPPFAFKSNHASGHYILVGAHDEMQKSELRARGAEWLSQRHGIMQDEPGYTPIRPRLMIEQMIVTDSSERPEEVRLFVFNGKVEVINTVFVEDGQIRNGAFHTPNWTRLNWYFSRALEREFVRPERLADMIRVAERLGKDLDHVRVDFYDCGRRIYISEMTLYSWSGLSRFNPDEADLALGSYWHIRRPLLRAAAAVLFGRREIARPLDIRP